ncbi:MAG: hypothetical protein AAGB34_10245, partial [Planctomycetota bacterium]
IVDAASYLEGFVYGSLSYFEAVLRPALGSCYEQYCEAFFKRAASAKLMIDDWTFDLSPYLWSSSDGSPTYLIFKYADLPLDQLVSNLDLWTGQGVFLTDSDEPSDRLAAMREAQGEILGIIEDAQQQAQSGVTDFDYFAYTVCSGVRSTGGADTWDGVLCLNCALSVADLPEQLQGIAAGIDPEQFVAHHVGITSSSILSEAGHQPSIHDTALFGLIRYEDSSDLFYTEQSPYQFRVRSLKVLFANSQVTNFSSQVELLVGRLFDQRASIVGDAPGGTLVLNGVWDRQDDVASYRFAQDSVSEFEIHSAVLDRVTIEHARLVTILDPSTSATSGELMYARFGFSGTLKFRALHGLDVFSFGDDELAGTTGGLSYANLGLLMAFNPRMASTQPAVFEFDAHEVSFDLSQSAARPNSLCAQFPLAPHGLIQGSAGSSPGTLGFMQIRSPLGLAGISGMWYGLTMELDLGNPGGLASRAGFFATLVVAWSPLANAYDKVYLGLKLPGSHSAAKEITIQGVLKLKASDIVLISLNEQDADRVTYMLQFYAISIGFLGAKFPPGGKTNLLLFGAPNTEGGANELGWYAAYAKDAVGQTGGVSESEMRRIL